MIPLIYLEVFIAVTFFYYGLACLFSARLEIEFERFGLSRYRVLTGILQLLGAAGIILGMVFPAIGFLAAAGLTLLMMAGFIVRIKIRDPVIQALPSFFFMLLNAYISYALYQLM